MFNTRRAAVYWAVGLAVLSAILVPDYRMQPFSLVFRPFIAPVLVALPLAVATYRNPRLLNLSIAVGLCLVLLAAYILVGTFVYWLSAGDALFDGMTIPIIALTAAINLVVVMLLFIIVWAGFRLRAKRHAS